MRLHKCGCVIVQLGERLNGIQEVSGSIPLISTTKASKSSDFGAFSFVLYAEMFCFSPLGFEGRNFLTQKLPNLDPNNNGIT